MSESTSEDMPIPTEPIEGAKSTEHEISASVKEKMVDNFLLSLPELAAKSSVADPEANRRLEYGYSFGVHPNDIGEELQQEAVQSPLQKGHVENSGLAINMYEAENHLLNGGALPFITIHTHPTENRRSTGFSPSDKESWLIKGHQEIYLQYLEAHASRSKLPIYVALEINPGDQSSFCLRMQMCQ